MATSGVSTFNATRNQIIRNAALLLKAVGANAAMNSVMIDDFAFGLNAMVKRWQAGPNPIHLWTTSEATLFPQPGQIRYAAGTGAADHITDSYVDTETSADEALGQTVISIEDPTGMTAADHIGIVLDDGTLQWTTIASVGATTVTLDDALTDSVTAGNKVFAYTNKIPQPLKVIDYRRFDIDGDTDTPVFPVARLDYQNIPLKTAPGSLNQVYYDRQLGTGYFHLWQVPGAVSELLKFTYRRPIMDFSSAANNPDLPQEWIQALYYNLAFVMAPQFHVEEAQFRRIERMAAMFLDDMMAFDREDESLFIQPDIRG